MIVDGDHDLLGDGSIELLLTPGHTPGHQSVRIGERLVRSRATTPMCCGRVRWRSHSRRARCGLVG